MSTGDPEVAHGWLARAYGRHRLQSVQRTHQFSCEVAVTTADQLRLDRVPYGLSGSAEFEDFELLLFHAAAAGRYTLSTQRVEVRFGPGHPGVYPTNIRLGLSWSADMDVFFLPLSRDVVADYAESALGLPMSQFRFDGVRPVSPALSRSWQATFRFVAEQLNAVDSILTYPLVRAEALRLLASTALMTFPNPTMNRAKIRGPGDVGPTVLRRAMAYIEAHASEPITLSQIAAASRTSGRAVQFAFARHVNSTPTAYLRRVRLEHAHRELLAADPSAGDTVAAIALRWGFAKPGHFAAAYRAAYGHLPRQTLRS